MRSDLPPQLFEQLLAAASEKVRVKLEAEREYAKSDIDKVVDEVAEKIQTGTATQPISYAAAQVLVESMHRAGLLTAGKLQEFAATGRFEEMVAALSVMSNVPTAVIEQNMRDTQAESLLVFAKAIGLSWETTRST
jgi:malate synthase